jgi:serine/threonine protein kinase/tetratricopeptide (TPR) repeat protein
MNGRDANDAPGERWPSRRNSIPVVAGRYRIESLLGRGGVGSVYRAFDTARAEAVALKRLELPAVAGSASTTLGRTTQYTEDDLRRSMRRRGQLLSLFQREYQTLAQLAHPRIIEVYDYGLLEGRPYYTMQLLEGSDLGALGRVPWRRVCSILRDVASALTLLHARRLLHRDVSPRNVHCTNDGHATLLDFGAMTPMGKSDWLIGTPAFVAPEVVSRQVLDGRADLYSLGVLGYTLLASRPPYAARAFVELREAFLTPPLRPSAHAPDVPKALDALIMQLIALDRAERPSSAVEVVERLSALAGLEHDSRRAIVSAYLSTPTLIGRELELTAVRRRAQRTLREDSPRGGSISIASPRGAGLTRLLNDCALQGRLAGSLVLVANAGAADSEGAVIRELLDQLQNNLSEPERSRFPVPDSLRRSLAREPARESDVPLSVSLREYLATFAAERPLMIVIDEFELIDAASAAAIASLVIAATTCRLTIVVGYEPSAEPAGATALRVVRDHSRHFSVRALNVEHTLELCRSVFGDVPNLRSLAARLHGLSAGKPGLVLEWARHLIDRGVIRFEAGGFVLPESFAQYDLPQSLEQALARRFAGLSPEARELGAMLALCRDVPITSSQCVRAAAGDGERALQELIAADVLGARGDRVTLQGELGSLLLAGVSPAERQRLHGRAAALLAEVPVLRVRAADHYLLAGMPEPALDILLPIAVSDLLSNESFPGYDAMLGRALEACAALGRPARDAFNLRHARVQHRVLFIEPGDVSELLAFARELEQLAGLAAFNALDPTLEAGARLARAFEMATEAYERSPERDRTLAPLDGIRELANFVAALAGYATATFDCDLLTRIPDLTPFSVLSPGIQIAVAFCESLRELRAGRHEAYERGYQAILARLEQPDHAELPDVVYRRAYLGVMYTTALTDAALGRPRAFERARVLETSPQHRASAWRVRRSAHLHRGERHEAEACQRELELLMLQDPTEQFYRGTVLETECILYARTDDVVGLRRAMPELERMAAAFPGWRPLLLIAQGEVERMRGHLEVALSHHEQAIALTQPGRHSMWSYAIAAYMESLIELGTPDRARAVGRTALEEVARHGLAFIGLNVTVPLAKAEAALGNYGEATALLETAMELHRANSVGGLFTGILHELRARIALRTGDGEGFWKHYGLCADQYGTALDSPFSQRLAQLRTEERLRSLAPAARASLAAASRPAQRVQFTFTTGSDASERFEHALKCLIEALGAQAGNLYSVESGELQLVASSRDRRLGDPLQAALQQAVNAGTLNDLFQTQLVGRVGSQPPAAAPELRDEAGVMYRPFALRAERDGRTELVAVAALAGMPDAEPEDASEVVQAVADELATQVSERLTLLR